MNGKDKLGEIKENQSHEHDAQLHILAEVSLQLNRTETVIEVTDYVCQQLKAIIGQGYAMASLMDNATQTIGIKSIQGIQDGALINNILHLTGSDPREMQVPVKDMTPEDLALFRSGHLQLLENGIYVLTVRKYPKAVCTAMEHLLNIRFIYTMGFVHHDRHLGGVIIMTHSDSVVEANRFIIENIVAQAAVIISRIYTDEQLRKISQHQETVMATIPDIIMEVDKNKIYTWANQAGIEFFGEDVLGKEAAYYFEREQETYQTVKPVFNGTPETTIYVESWQRRKDGAKRLLAWWCRSLKDNSGEIIGALSAAQDITDLRSNELKLIESRKKFRALVETTNDFIWEMNPSGAYTYCSPQMEKLWGLKPEDMLGKTPFDLLPPEDRERAVRGFSMLSRSSSPFENMELRSLDGFGQIRFLEISGVPFFDLEAKCLGYRGITRDITERKRAETENQKLREQAEISSRLAAIGEMAAGIAHEINNPLTGVIGFAQLLGERQDLPPDVKDQLKIINDGGNRVKNIVSRMLTFARQHKPAKTSVNINELIENTLEIRNYVLETANIEVIKHLDPSLPNISVDSGQIQQVFLNLIVNAEYSMKKAHGKGTLTITTEKTDGRIRISFRDDGTGMDKTTKEKLFHPFFSTKPVNEGTGLGLSLSRSIIMEHGGAIRVESELGQGATFTITLPLTFSGEAAVPSSPAESNTSPENFRRARMLVVDDETAIRSLVSTILARSGHTVDVTDDSKEALRKLETLKYDVVIMDIRMPDMSGMELYDLLINTHPELSSKFLFITGDSSDSQIKVFLEHYNLPYITKPFDRATLLRKVNELL